MNDIIITLDRITRDIEHLPELQRRLDDLLLDLRFLRLKQPLPRPADVTIQATETM